MVKSGIEMTAVKEDVMQGHLGKPSSAKCRKEGEQAVQAWGGLICGTWRLSPPMWYLTLVLGYGFGQSVCIREGYLQANHLLSPGAGPSGRSSLCNISKVPRC